MHINRYSDLCRPGHVQQFLQSWSDLHVRSESYPLALVDAQDHADAFMRAAKTEGISQVEIQEAIHGSNLRDIMIVRMRDSVERALEVPFARLSNAPNS